VSGLNLTAEQARALAAYAVPGRRLFVEHADEADVITGGPIAVAIGEHRAPEGFRRVAEATIDEAGRPEWKAA
jgi:hypothetical protein